MYPLTKLTVSSKGHLTPTQALELIVHARFKPFNRYDWQAFAGCQSEHPLIAESGDYVLVWDADCVNIIHMNDEYGGQVFTLLDANA
jgi:hypothetical protein